MRAGSKGWLVLPGKPQEEFSEEVTSGLGSEYKRGASRCGSTMNENLGKKPGLTHAKRKYGFLREAGNSVRLKQIRPV